LTNNPVLALNASAPGGDRDAATRGAALVPTAGTAVPDAASPTGTLQTNTPAASTAGAADPAVFKLHQGLDSPDFPQALADKVAWLVDKDIGSAKLQINPPQLGPIDVHIEVQGDKAQVWLSAHSVVTREALEASSPKLRDMLGSQGFAQVNVDVSQRSFQDRSAPASQTQWLPTAARTGPDELFAAPAAQPRRAGPGALDAYA
jgi:flagellar hook-length control protein FliK